MDRNREIHLQINAATRVNAALEYLNERHAILRGLTKEQSHAVVSSIFKTYAFDKDDWQALVDSEQPLPSGLKVNKSMNYETAIKKISEQLHKKANPEPEMRKHLEEKANKEEAEQTQEESIFEQEGVTTRNHADKSIQSNKVSIFGKELDLHIRLNPEVEKTIVRLAHEGEAAEAHDVMKGYIQEMLQPQLSARDMELANTPTDFQIKKQAFGSAGAELVTQVRNKSLVDALTCAHIGLICLKHQFEVAKEAAEHKAAHSREELGEMIAGIPPQVEGDLCNICDHMESVYGTGTNELQAPTSIYDNINSHDELVSFAKTTAPTSESTNVTAKDIIETVKDVVETKAKQPELDAEEQRMLEEQMLAMSKRPWD